MNRAKLWSAFVVATVTAGTGCGSLPTIDELAYKHVSPTGGTARSSPHSKGQGATPPANATQAGGPSATTGTAPQSNGFNFIQENYLGSVTGDGNTSVKVEQENRAVTVVLDEVRDLLLQYNEVKCKLAWDRGTNTFYISDYNLSSGGKVKSGSNVEYRQLNNLLIVIDQDATTYSGVIDQFNGIDTVDVGEGGEVAIAQLNNVTVIHAGQKAQDADDYVAALRYSLYGENGSANQVHDWLLYIDADNQPHVYQKKVYKGKANTGSRWGE